MKDKIHETPPSQTFADLVCTTHSPITDCDFCGRHHFADPNPESSFASSDLLSLRIEASQNPDRYYRHELSDGVAFGVIGGRRIPYGCPCNALGYYENLIWENRQLIISYLQRRAGEMMATGVSIMAAVDKIENPSGARKSK